MQDRVTDIFMHPEAMLCGIANEKPTIKKHVETMKRLFAEYNKDCTCTIHCCWHIDCILTGFDKRATLDEF